MKDWAPKELWVTTFDNPFNPFTQEKDWWEFDCSRMGYNTWGRIARDAPTSEENLTAKENDDILDQAMINLVLNKNFDVELPDKTTTKFYRLVSPKDCVAW